MTLGGHTHREDVQLEITDWQELDDRLVTKWRFRCILQLPWRPVLAAAGGTQHVFDPVRLSPAYDAQQFWYADQPTGDRPGGGSHRVVGC